VTNPSSVRFDPDVLARIGTFVAAHPGLSLSSASNLLIDEALRTREHPTVVFRDGPGGRRARLIGGPDVWEVIQAVQSARAAEPSLSARRIRALVAESAGLTVAAADAAIAYWAAYPTEVDSRIDRARAESAQLREHWQRTRRLLDK